MICLSFQTNSVPDNLLQNTYNTRAIWKLIPSSGKGNILRRSVVRDKYKESSFSWDKMINWNLVYDLFEALWIFLETNLFPNVALRINLAASELIRNLLVLTWGKNYLTTICCCTPGCASSCSYIKAGNYTLGLRREGRRLSQGNQLETRWKPGVGTDCIKKITFCVIKLLSRSEWGDGWMKHEEWSFI